MLKLTFSSSVTRGVGSIRGMVNNHADTYMMGADRKVLITIPDVTLRKDREKDRLRFPQKCSVHHCSPEFWNNEKVERIGFCFLK